ncbi:serine/threonine-protein kinase [Aeromicrobium sp. CTD01-1L150]|uniref:serine/threonine-protein kinase n=1 Tax=Aeromicrobium sp. CTD01-1L150 TaxID=3341830 RepID=UPI0035BFB4E4
MSEDTWQLAGGDELVPGLVLLEDLGGGTVFEAWLAHDERLLAPVVVKVIRPSRVDDPATRYAFEREVDLLSALNHPGIARLYAYADGDRPHLVLEHVEGPNLSRLISKHGALPPHQLYAVALELASALHYLTGQGYCHLDVKPSNVIAGAPARLIDLSVAMSHQEAAVLDHPVGSDEYMAPEQCISPPTVRHPRESLSPPTVRHPRESPLPPTVRHPRESPLPPTARHPRRGESAGDGAPGPASDVWGLGATLFRAAAGHRAFDRDRTWPQLTDEPAALPRGIDPRFASILADCLQRDPTQRPTPAQVADRLGPLIADLPTARLAGFSLRR